MGEFDEHNTEPTPEVQLLARMKLQRVVFGALAIVLVSLFALGLSAYRQMQGEKSQAEGDAQVARDITARAVNERAEVEKRLARKSEELKQARRALALEKARLAIHEVRDGHPGRARDLIAEARRLDPPAWLPLVTRLAEDAPARFSGSEYPGRAILCGALSGDGTTLAVTRLLPDSELLIEFYNLTTGRLIESRGVAGKAEDTGARCHLLLSHDAQRYFLRLPGRVYAGGRNGAAHDTVPPGDVEVGPAISIDAAPDLDTIYECDGRGILVRRRMPGGHYAPQPFETGIEDIRAVAAAAGRLVFESGGVIYLAEDGREPVELYRFDFMPERVALHYGAGPVFAAGVSGETIDLASIEIGGEVTTARHLATGEHVEDLRFLGDDSLLWVGRSGRVMVAEFGNRRARILGDTVPTFVERHPQGLVFGNRKGELNIRANEDSPLTGRSVRVVPPGWRGEPQAHGFIVTGPRGEQFVKQRGRWQAVPAGGRIALTPRGPSWSGEDLRLPDGTHVENEGVLIGGFADGGVLLFAGGGKLRYERHGEVAETLLRNELAPDTVSVAAQARVVALRMRDSIYVTDFADEPRLVANSIQVSPDLIALDATGGHLAVAYGPTVSVRGPDGHERFVRTSAPPREIALLFGGSVLVTVERGALVFYEVRLGRELARAGRNVTGVKASGVGALNLVADGRLRTVDFTPGE